MKKTLPQKIAVAVLASFVVMLIQGCQKKNESAPVEQVNLPSEDQVAPKYLYVASGACYSGNGISTFSTTTASNLIYRLRVEDGFKDQLIFDYNASPAAFGDSPVSIEAWGGNKLMALIRNGAAVARLETIHKGPGFAVELFGTNPALSSILSTTPAAMAQTADGSLLITRTGFIERISSTGVRPSPNWVNSNLGAACGTANSFLTQVVVSKTGKIITANAAPAPNNRLISLPAAGANGTCLSSMAAPTPTAYATALAMDQTLGKVLVAYSGPTTAVDVNSIYIYDFDESTGAFSNPQKVYDANQFPALYSYLLFGVSALTIDEGNLYVATAVSAATTVSNYVIEKFKINYSQLGVNNQTVLTRVGSVPFYGYGYDTKCISSLKVLGD